MQPVLGDKQDISWAQHHGVRGGLAEPGVSDQVRMLDIDLAEDTGFFIGEPGGVEQGGLAGGKQVPSFPAIKKHRSSQCLQSFVTYAAVTKSLSRMSHIRQFSLN